MSKIKRHFVTFPVSYWFSLWTFLTAHIYKYIYIRGSAEKLYIYIYIYMFECVSGCLCVRIFVYFRILAFLRLETSIYLIASYLSIYLSLLSVSRKFNLTISNTLYQQTIQCKTYWMHPCSKNWHMVDYVTTQKT